MNIIAIILVFIFLGFGVPISALYNFRYNEKHNFQCTKCFHVFDIGGNALNSFRTFTKLYVKCPNCRRYVPVKIVRKE
ncbi:hypothetical protein [Clostridium felsineum]|uniref:Uncharacterized protein n=1 Tax=Clostridium felsineum TaxID=36839 RepID=A0A1S8L1J9_9CLOT|nr:hypothetical protein [Clostridium felsineum]URZ04554.1 hypothetical protein CLAUR_046430 [Clostridium felsineum]URZ09213.1 hypothetical protein CLROS_046290 [Clostridium felsineum]URZ13899.1 hypothetical protein CROST_046770 [Clostridium felsineum]